MATDTPQLNKVGPDEFETTNETTRTYNKSSVEQEIETLKTVIDKKEKQVGLKSLRRELEEKQALLDQMKQTE